MKKLPPKNALKFLRWFCREDYLEEIEGDAVELYEKKFEESPRRANSMFWWLVICHFRPDFIRSFQFNPIIHTGMLKNYFKIAWRSMLKQKMYSVINIGGLTVGLTCFILVLLYVQHEFSYDQFLPNSERIYRVYQKTPGQEYLGTDNSVFTAVGLAPTLISDIPEVDNASTIKTQTALLSYNTDHYYEDGLWADTHFFIVFPFPFVEGDPKVALATTSSIVLTESFAYKIFGNENAVGQEVVYQNRSRYTVTGIMKDLPANASFQFSFVTGIQSNGQYAHDIKTDLWNNNDYYTFFSLVEGGDPLAVQNKLSNLVKKYNTRESKIETLHLVQSLSNMHFETKFNYDFGLKANPKYISLFSLIAILVLLLSCANYMNLAIARSIKRASEVGLRKVVGARQGQLVGQFLWESILITFIALLIALSLSHFLAPIFGNLLDRPLELNLLENVFLLPALLLLVIIVGIMSGSYPAFLMSSLRPVQVLKGKLEGRFSGLRMQRWLMIGQYAVSIVLIISSVVIYRQFQFIQNKELGYNKEHVITISALDRSLRDKIDEIRNEWSRNPNIVSITTAAELPSDVTSGTRLRHVHQDKEDGFTIYRARHGYNYLDVFGIDLIAGRHYSPEIKTDWEEAIIINEMAAKQLGWTPEEAIGKQVRDHFKRTVIGVVRDFHMHSMHAEIAPLMLPMEDYFTYIAVKIRPDNLKETVSFLEKSLKEYSPYPFEYQFLDEKFDELYKADLRLGEMFGFFTLLSILIASLGLFGLAAFMTRQRTKEIGVRKVLGASVNSIISMLSKDFMKMILVGFLLAIPIAWLAMNRWLKDFAYRIEMEWWMFALAGLGAMVIAIFTVSSQSLKAALANPVDSLKNE